MKRFLSFAGVAWMLAAPHLYAQQIHPSGFNSPSLFVTSQPRTASLIEDSASAGVTYPDPHQVLYKSLIIPGWGQVVNKQIWKVPIIYALFGGLTGYSIYLTKRYHDYRAAYYNLNSQNKQNDQRFGPTPAYLQNGNVSSLKSNRDALHNRRDFIYVTLVLAYGLNAIDAYVFANLRSFDVSDDLSVRTTVKPHILAGASPGVTLSFNLFNRTK